MAKPISLGFPLQERFSRIWTSERIPQIFIQRYFLSRRLRNVRYNCCLSNDHLLKYAWKRFMRFLTPSQTSGNFRNFGANLDPLMKFVVIAIPIRHFLRSRLSHYASKLANPFHLWTIKKKTHKLQFHHVSEAKPQRWSASALSCCKVSRTQFILQNILFISKRVSSWWMSEKTTSPMESVHHPHNTALRYRAGMCNVQFLRSLKSLYTHLVHDLCWFLPAGECEWSRSWSGYIWRSGQWVRQKSSECRAPERRFVRSHSAHILWT